MSYKTDIQNAVLKLEGGAFQNLCDEFLNECGYNNIVSLGSKPGTNKTTSGTPDTYYCIDSNGKYIFIEYTTQQESIYKIRFHLRVIITISVRPPKGKCKKCTYYELLHYLQQLKTAPIHTDRNCSF